MVFQLLKEGFNMEIVYKTNKNFKNANAFLFGLKGFSTLEEEITLEELSTFSDKKIFLSIDKNMFNSDLKGLEDILSSIIMVFQVFFFMIYPFYLLVKNLM